MIINLSRNQTYTIIICCLLYYITGCTTISTESTLMKEMEGVKMTSIELGIRLNEFGKYFAGVIEETADEIIENSNNIKVKKNALEWKINIIPKAWESLAILDPIAAGTDIYALCLQMEYFLRSGNGRNLFGKQQYLALKASEEIINEIRSLSFELRDNKHGDEFESQLTIWVQQNPIKNLRFNRKSTLDILAKALGSEEYGLGSTVGSIAEGVHDLRRQITLYTEFLPKHIKWQMEYELYNMSDDTTVGKTIANLNRIGYSTEKMSKILDESPEYLKDLQQSTFTELNKQLLLTLSTMQNERATVLKTLVAERIAMTQEINQQRIETIESINSLTKNTITESSLIANELIDKIFLRVLLIIAIIFFGWFVIKRFNKK